MFTRSTPGCGTLDGPSLAWAASRWPRLRRPEGSPGPRLPSADGQLSGSQVTFVWYMSGIYMVYTWYIPGISCPTVNHASAFWVLSSSCPENPCRVHVFPIHPVLIASLKPCKTKGSLKRNVYTMHIHSICHVYTRYVWYTDLKANYAFLYISGYILLSSTMSLVCSIELRINTWKRISISIVCTWYMPYIYRRPIYTWNIHGIYWLYTSSGFQMKSSEVGTLRPSVLSVPVY